MVQGAEKAGNVLGEKLKHAIEGLLQKATPEGQRSNFNC